MSNPPPEVVCLVPHGIIHRDHQVRDGTLSVFTFLRDRLPPPPPPSPRHFVSVAEPSQGAVRFRVMSYNILAESYATAQIYPYCPSWALQWEYRKDKVLKVRAACPTGYSNAV